MRTISSTMARLLRFSTLGTLGFASCNISDGSICTHFANDSDPSCQPALVVNCPAAGTFAWGQPNTLVVSQLLVPPIQLQVTLAFADSQLALDPSQLGVDLDKHLVLTLTPPTNAAVPQLQRGGPVQVKLQVGTSYSGSSDSAACVLRVPPSFAANPDMKVSYGPGMPPTQVFELQYGGLIGTEGRLYVNQLAPLASLHQVERLALSPDHSKLVSDPAWTQVRDNTFWNPTTCLGANNQGLLGYDAQTLFTAVGPAGGAKSSSVPDKSFAGKHLAAAQDLGRFLLTNGTQIGSFSFDGKMPPVALSMLSTSLSNLTDGIAVTMRTAPPLSQPSGLTILPAEIAAWSVTAAEIFDFDTKGGTYARNVALSQSATMRLTEIVPRKFDQVKLALADMDDDGMSDLIALDPANGDIKWARQQAAWEPDGAGFASFASTGVNVVHGVSLTAGDLDGNRSVDLAVATWDPVALTGQTQVFLHR